MRIKWYKKPRIQNLLRVFARVAAMSRHELIFRVTKPVKDRLLQFRLFLNKSLLSDPGFLHKFDIYFRQHGSAATKFHHGDSSLVELESEKSRKTTGGPSFFFCHNAISSLKNSFKANAKNQTIQRAEEILHHNFQLLGLKMVGGSRINWHLDPTTGKEWPKIFRGTIRYDSNSFTKDVKYIWELNRHKHFVTLGKAYILTDDEKYAEEFAKQISDWIEHNPAEVGINWISNLEVAIRMIAWIWAYHMFRTSTSFDDDTRCNMLKSIYQHGRHVFLELSVYTDPTNHLIGEATALWMIGLLFPEFRGSQKWKDVAFEILQRELIKQVHDDGVNAEQAISYHRFVLDFYTQVIVLAQKNDISIPDDVLRKMEKMFEFIMELVDSNGRVPMIGDADNARGLPVANGDFWDFRDTLSTGAVLFNRPDMKALAGEFHETSLWLLGLSGKEKFDVLPVVKPKYVSTAFPRGGYYIMKAEGENGPMRMVFDCGPLGYPPNADHGHADMLSFTLNVSGEQIIVDPGTYGYSCAGDKRDYFRGTRAHNTVVVDDLDQADPFGTFKWLNIPQATIHKWITTERYDFIEAFHNGYTRLKDPITHRRMIFFVKPEYWIIVDLLDGSGFHQFHQYFHFAPGSLRLDPISKVATMTTEHEVGLILAPANPEVISAAIFEGSKNPFEGWLSYSYGESRPAPVIRYRKQSQTPTTFVTVLIPFSGKTRPSLVLKSIKIQESNISVPVAALELQIDAVTDYFILSSEKAIKKSWERYESDADSIYLRTDRNGRVHKIFLGNGSFFLSGNDTLLRSQNRQEFFEAEFV